MLKIIDIRMFRPVMFNLTTDINVNKLIYDIDDVKEDKSDIKLEFIDINYIKELEKRLGKRNTLRNLKLRDEIFYLKYQVNELNFVSKFYIETQEMKKIWISQRITNNQLKLNKLYENNHYYEELILKEIQQKGFNLKMKKVDEERKNYFSKEIEKTNERINLLNEKYNFLKEEINDIESFKKIYLEENFNFYFGLKRNVVRKEKVSKNLKRKCEEAMLGKF